ncbi:hypothetical protein OQH61_03085 [Helicobacter sp. MIT 21-1697]|uniref:hypothetical protein n=1 Tax=Helicobacter sp. MIT 21-1697 TaxID=2993733 RepID=UPI00224ACB0A|nr:hypothetical protein [Helicobacter sp. MIT 21-1697]MCX2716716.1 hypothetical protein [Helicobacter sp. MIT 21-1697]
MQFNTIDALVRKFYMLKEKGFVANSNYKEDLQKILSEEEFTMFNTMFEQDSIDKAIDNVKHSYTAGYAKKQCVINILSEPKITQIASVLLKGSQTDALEKAIRLREHTDKASIIFLEFMRSIEDKLLTFLTSRINNFPSNISPDNFTQTLARKEISLSNVARYFGGDFEKAYLGDKGVGKTYFDFLTCQVLEKHKFMRTEDVQRLLLVFIWNSLPTFLSKTRFTSVGSVH